jgi:polyhydroxybutyrate depolymerase
MREQVENLRLKLFSVKKAALAAAFLAVAASSLCLAAPASAAARLTIESGGIARHAVVVLRDRLKLRRRPLVIVLHRGGGFGAHIRRRLGLEEIAQTSRPIFLYPDAINGVWPSAPGPDADRDVKFLRDLVQHFISQGAVDPRKIFLVGVSSGGAFAYRAACADLGHPVAGLATLIAAMPADLANCAPQPLSYIAVSNFSDPRIPYAGGKATLTDSSFDAMPAESAFALFAKINSCGARHEDKPFTEREGRGAAKTVRGAVLSYNGCKAPVELIRVENGGHRIPGHKPDHLNEAGGDEGGDFDASRAVWEFLKRNGA